MELLSQTAVFLLCFLVVSGTSCPEREEVYPCDCEDEDGELVVSCFGQGISQQDIKRALNRLGGTRIDVLELNNLRDVGKLKGDLFAGHDIRKLDITHSDFEALTDGDKPPFYGLEDSLEELEILGSMEDSSSLQLTHLRKLREVDLSYNELNKIEADSFPSSLETLILSNNVIEKLDDHAFVNLVNLRTLWLDGNILYAFRRSWLPESVEELRELELDNNDLTSLPRDAFSKMPSLRRLSLRTNDIQSMEQETWEGVWQQLDRISMEGNPLVCDSNMEWMQQMEEGPLLSGLCHGPADVAGVELHEWVKMSSPE